MTQTIAAKVSCPTCGKEYRWKPELAGKRCKCKCGGVLSIPAAPPVQREPEPEDPFGDGAFNFADEPECSTPAPAASSAAMAPPPPPPPAARPVAGGTRYDPTLAAAAASGVAEQHATAARQLKWVPALRWFGIGAVAAVLAVWELSSPTDPDAPGRKRGLRGIFVFANMIHPRGAFFVVGAFALFMIVVGVMILFGKSKDDDYEQAQAENQWPASRGRR